MLAALAACAAHDKPPSTTVAARTGRNDAQLLAERERQDREAKQAIVTKHRALESTVQDALGATCDDLTRWAPQHCTPSCYPPAPKDPRAGTKLAGKVELQHHVCQRIGDADSAPWLIVEELDDKKLVARPHRGRPPKAHKKATWQAEIASSLADHRIRKAPRDEVFIVLGGPARATTHPVTHEELRCVMVAQYTTLPRSKIDACGTTGKSACEASGNAAARGINLARFRIAEAAQLHASGKDLECQAAALDALATARGLPRWRQYTKLNIGAWTEGLAYKTRFDGILDEDALFALATSLAAQAEAQHAECGGASSRTTPAQEHAFHSCP